MKKSVYSLVLMDDVIEAVDRLAYSIGTSRSNLINQILAERVALTTPEMQMKNIFESMQMLLDHYQHFQIQPQAADSMMSIRSVLKYKYNPTIRYAVTLLRENGPRLGEVKMISRSQSDVLQNYLAHFFDIWTQYEQDKGMSGWVMDQGGKWSRILGRPEGMSCDDDTVAQAIVAYIKAVDDGLKIYCNHLDAMTIAKTKLYEHFNAYYHYQKFKI
ncbi:MAG: CopG family transcriptional regulator [Cellulosilyticaceae bacterium]